MATASTSFGPGPSPVYSSSGSGPSNNSTGASSTDEKKTASPAPSIATSGRSANAVGGVSVVGGGGGSVVVVEVGTTVDVVVVEVVVTAVDVVVDAVVVAGAVVEDAVPLVGTADASVDAGASSPQAAASNMSAAIATPARPRRRVVAFVMAPFQHAPAGDTRGSWTVHRTLASSTTARSGSCSRRRTPRSSSGTP